MSLPRTRFIAAFAEAREILAAQQDAAADDAPRRVGNEPQDRTGP